MISSAIIFFACIIAYEWKQVNKYKRIMNYNEEERNIEKVLRNAREMDLYGNNSYAQYYRNNGIA
jgi:hypothetical protein